MLTLFTDGEKISLLCHPRVMTIVRDAAHPAPPQVGDNLAVVGNADDPLNRLEAELAAASAQNAIDEAVENTNSRAGELLDQFVRLDNGSYQLNLSRHDAATLGSWCNAQYVKLRMAEFDDAGVSSARGPAAIEAQLAEILGEDPSPDMGERTIMWAALSQALSGLAL
jgi:hypothetical protein